MYKFRLGDRCTIETTESSPEVHGRIVGTATWQDPEKAPHARSFEMGYVVELDPDFRGWLPGAQVFIRIIVAHTNNVYPLDQP